MPGYMLVLLFWDCNQEITTGGAFSLSEQGGAGENPLATHFLAVQKTDAPAVCGGEG